MAERKLQSNPTSVHVFERSYIPNFGTDLVWPLTVPNPNEVNSALTYHVLLGNRTDARLRTTAEVLSQIMFEPAFNILRTREQLGYSVSCGLIVTPGESELVLRIRIQSERSPAYLEERTNAFLDEMQGLLEEMEEEEFETHKAGLASIWKEQPRNLSEESIRFWRWIENGFLDFNHGRLCIELGAHVGRELTY